MSAAPTTPHLGSLAGRALRPLRAVVILWVVLAGLTFWGTPRISLTDAFAVSYNENSVVGILLGLTLASASLQVLSRLVPSVPSCSPRYQKYLAHLFATCHYTPAGNCLACYVSAR
jgi:hypothetical protein